MSPAFPAPRRADEFDRLVAAGAAADRRATKAADELRELAALATSLRTLSDAAVPSRDFSLSLRDRLMAAADTELAPAREQAAAKPAVERKLTVGSLRHSTRPRRPQRRLTVAIAALAIVGGTAGAATASQSALPGDSLYPMKRAVENVSAGFTAGPRDRGLKVLSDAGTRLREVRSLTAGGQMIDPEQVTSTLETFSSQSALASDLLIRDYRQNHRKDSISQLRTFAADGVQELASLHSGVPKDATPALTDAAQTLLLIDQASAALCPTCEGGVTSLPSSLVASLTPDVDGLLPSDNLVEAQALPPLTKDGNSDLALPSIDPSDLGPGSVTDPDKKKSGTNKKAGDQKAGESGQSGGGLLTLPSLGPSASPSPSSSPSGSSAPASETPVVGPVVDTVGGLVDGLTSVLKTTTSGLLGQ